MKYLKLLLLAISATCLAGCASHTTSENSKLPWAKPAYWQHQGPQMGASISY